MFQYSNQKAGCCNKSCVKLFAANETPINVYRTTTRKVNLGLRREFSWQFLIANVNIAIIAADFISHFGLLIDLKRNRLIDKVTELETNCAIYPGMEVNFTTYRFIRSFVVRWYFEGVSIHYDFTAAGDVYWIEGWASNYNEWSTNFLSPCRLNVVKLAAAKKEFDVLMKAGICLPSISPWASPLHMVRKPNGSWRPYGDYRELNNITVPDIGSLT